MKAKIGIREFSRKVNNLELYDYIEVVDKKTKKSKGIFVSEKYAEVVKDFLENIIKEKKLKELNEIMKFKGILSGDTKNLKFKELKEMKIKDEK